MADEAKNAFVLACVGFADEEVGRAEQEVAVLRHRVDSLSDELLEASRSLHAARLRCSALEAARKDEVRRLREDFDSLVRLPMVRGVEVEEGQVCVLTDRVVLSHAGRRYLIGEFVLQLDPRDGIVIRNVSNTIRRGGWEHPHVQGGLPCLGNLRDGLLKLLGERELVPLTSMLIQFLQSYEPATAYCSVDSWQEVPP